jgi:hypothetical protein
MIDFSGKNVLFFSPKSFNYEFEIKKSIEDLGANVDYYDERPSNETWVKAAIRINSKIVKNIIAKYYDEIINANKTKLYSYILFINIESPSNEIMDKLKKTYPDATFLLYLWDSILHRPYPLKLLKYFDAVYTYDRPDSIKYNFSFRPLFYLPEYTNISNELLHYDISFIGTIHSDRFGILNDIKKQCSQLNLNALWFFYIHNNAMFYRMKFSRIENLPARKRDFSFSPLKKDSVVKILQESRIIVDFQHPENNGLTMRTLEALGLKKKLITTNKDIVNYDFYNPNNICVIDRQKPIIDKNFINSDYTEIPSNIYAKYSISSWVSDIFQNKGLLH